MTKSSKILAIYGSGGLGKEILDLAHRTNMQKKRWDKFIFINDFTDEKFINGIEVFKFKDLDFSQNLEFIIAVGEPSSRQMLYDKIKGIGGGGGD